MTFPPLGLKTLHRQSGEAKASVSPGLFLQLISVEGLATDVFRAAKPRKGAKEQRKSARDNHADHSSAWQKLNCYDKSQRIFISVKPLRRSKGKQEEDPATNSRLLRKVVPGRYLRC